MMTTAAKNSSVTQTERRAERVFRATIPPCIISSELNKWKRAKFSRFGDYTRGIEA